MKITKLFNLFFLLSSILLHISDSFAGTDRVALIIGNDSYTHLSTLKNARSDARAISKSLQKAGYKVTLKLDLDEKGMKRAIGEFADTLSGSSEVIFYFAGHGVQLGGSNYLIPIDLVGEREKQVRDDAISLQKVLDDIQEQKTKFTLAIIDACRDNPFKGNGRSFGSRGLVPTNPATGQMIIFSAGTGQQALDRVGPKDNSSNGLFTRIFLKEIERPGVLVRDLLYNVREEVVKIAKTVDHDQVPAIYDQSVGRFYIQPGTAPTSPISINPSGSKQDSVFWTSISSSKAKDDFLVYLEKFPTGTHRDAAHARIAEIDNEVKLSEEKIAWERAEKLASIEGYAGYLGSYPEGTFSTLASSRISRLERAPSPTKSKPKKPTITIETSLGRILLELYPDKAPKTVENFLKYVNDDFYRGSIFHRVIRSFMIQGGGFTPEMTQKTTRAPVVNEAKNGLKNERGSIAMARTSNPDSATAQFFINHADNTSLDYPRPDGFGYTVFGKVVEGMEVVDKIANVATSPHPSGHRDVPQTPVLIQSITLLK